MSDTSALPWNHHRRFCLSPFRSNLPAYFDRIGYTGSYDATLDNLKQIQLLHCKTIPFENCDMHIIHNDDRGNNIIIDPAVIENKLVHNNRGGYCFEQNTYFFYMMLAMGFQVRPIISRGRWLIADGIPTTPTHLIVHAIINGKSYICDVGFCNCTPTEPIEITAEEQVTAYDRRRIIQYDDEIGSQYMMQVKFQKSVDWMGCYNFKLDEIIPIDIDLANWWASTSPQHKFTKNLIVANIAEKCRYILTNNVLMIRYVDGSSEKLTFANDEVAGALKTYFGLDFPTGTSFACLK